MNVAVRLHVRLALLGLGLLVLPVVRVEAAGFAIENQGARAMGFAGAYVAQSYDPSAVFWNAAGVAFLPGRQIYLSAGVGSLGTDFTGEGPFPVEGTFEQTERRLGILPSVYYTQQVSRRWVVGLGFYAPFGFRSEWTSPDEFTGRYICTDCQVRAYDLNPTLAFKIADRLAIGGGVSLRFASLEHHQRLLAEPNPFPEPTDVGELSIEGASDTAIGWNVGLLASPSEQLSFGLHYRSAVSVEYSATAAFSQILTGDDAVDESVAAGLPPNQPVLITYTFPSSLTGGIAVKGRNWTVEGDVTWTRWSSFDTVLFTYPDEEGITTSELPQRYEDTWEGRIGVEYLLSETWAIRGGYSYDHSPQPTDTLSPFLHDEDRHGFGVGGTYRHEGFEIDLFGRYLLFRDRSTDGLSSYEYEGLYKTTGLQLGAAIGYRF
jgi:long-chain fatty acid transport protein